MRRYAAILLTLACAGGLALRPARAEHFDITLRLHTSRGEANARWDTSPPEMGFNPREVVSAAAGEDLPLEWSCRSEYPHGPMRNVRIHIYVVPVDAAGQKTPPAPNAPHVFDNEFTGDFLPKHLSRGVVHFRIRKPGVYLVRLQSEETEKGHGHEHFAALDLKIE